MTTRYLPLLVFLLLLSSITALAALEAPAPSVSFTHGLASGDVTPVSAVLWTRVNMEVPLTVEVSGDRDFRRLADRRTVVARASDGFTAQVTVFSLLPHTTYFYRFRHGHSVSAIGRFKTAPLPFVATDVRFAYAGDSDGTQVQGAPFFNRFESLDSARLDDPDFFVYLGDTIYANSTLRALSGESISNRGQG